MSSTSSTSRLPRWLTDSTQRALFLDALATVDPSLPIPVKVDLANNRSVQFAERVRDIDRHEGTIDNEFWQALDAAGFPWRSIANPRRFSYDAPSSFIPPKSSNTLKAELAEIARGTATFRQVLALRDDQSLKSDPVVAWANRGVRAMREAGVSVVEACADPNRTVRVNEQDFALGAFTRELMNAAVAGVLEAIAPRLSTTISKSNLLLLRNLGLAAQWHAEHPTQSIPSELVVTLHNGTPYELGRWVLYKRQTIRKGRAHPRLIDALNHSGIDAYPSRFDRAWTRGITAFEQFIAREGHSRVPHDHVEFLPDGSRIDLEAWWRRTRAQYRAGELPEECITRLQTLDIALEGVVRVREDSFRMRLADIDRFIKEHGHANIPGKYISVRPNGRRTYLGTWITYIRARAEAGLLSPEHLAALQRRGVRIMLRNPENLWETGVAALAQFRAREGLDPVTERHCETLPDGTEVMLGAWIARNKMRYREGQLAQERIDILRQHGVDLDTKRNFEQEWLTGLDAFRQFAVREHHGLVPAGHKEVLPDGTTVALGNWVSTKRKQFKAGRVPADRIEILEALGFEWSHDAVYFRTGVALLREYRKREGHVDVPQRYVTAGPDGTQYPLGSFVATRRMRLRNGLATPDERAVLEALGLSGEHRLEALYRDGLRAFDAFVNDHGHGLVPRNFVATNADGGTINLGSWVTNQRNQHRDGLLPAHRFAELSAHGFIWNQIATRFEWCLAALERAQLATGQYLPPEGHLETLPDGSTVKIGQWVRSQRDRFREGYMTEDQLAALHARSVLTDLTIATAGATATTRAPSAAGR